MTQKISIECSYDKLVLTNTLKLHPRNPNVHPDLQIQIIAKVIQENGWRVPITVSNLSGYIVRGNGG